MASISQVTSLRTNINSFGGQVISLNGIDKFKGIEQKVSTATLGGFGDNSIDKYYEDLSELAQYQTSKIATTSVGIIKEYIVKFESNADDLISISDNGQEIEESKLLNNLFRSIGFLKYLNDNLDSYVYFGSNLSLIKVPKSNKLSECELIKLRYPYSSIIHRHNKSEDYYINGNLLKLKQDEYYYLPLRLGKLDLSLDKTQFNPFYSNLNDTVLDEDSWLASKPLFHGLLLEFKLFILKDILTQLIQIQDIVAPNLLLANVDKNTSQESAVELAKEIENLINQYGDLTKLISSNADITTLSQFILNNVRVYPDLLGILRGTEKFDFSRLVGRNNEIQGQLEANEEGLVNAIGIPIDLYKGRGTNKYDALRQSDRLIARVQSEMNSLDESLVQFCVYYLKSIGKYKPNLLIKSNLFDYSFISGINSGYKYESTTQNMRNLGDMANMIKSTIESNYEIYDPEKLYKYLTDNAEIVFPGFKDLIRPDFLTKLKESKEAESVTEDPMPYE